MPLDWSGMTAEVIGQLGDQVTLYPTTAALAVGSGVTITGIFERRPQLNEQGRTDNLDETLCIDDETVAENAIVRGMSVRFDGRLYDIVRIVPDYPGAIECYLAEYLP